MTLSERNIFFKSGIIFSLLCILLCTLASVRIIPVYELIEEEIFRRPESLVQALIGKNMDVRLLAVHFSVIVLVLFSFFSVILIYYFFEKTQSPEILFIAFFTASLSTEVFRLVIPFWYMNEIPSLYLILSSRMVLFGRFFGLFSLFTASVFAAGYDTKRGNVILVIIVVTLIMALGIPVDTQNWNTSFCMVNGYISMFRLIEIGIFLITAISFFVAAWRRGSREFIFIGAGSVLVFLGRHILLNNDTWIGLPVGLLFLVIGAWLMCSKIHKIYLWL